MPRSKTAYPTPTQTAGPSYFATKGSKTPQVISWDQVYALITQDRHVSETTQKARQYRDQGNPQAYAATKARAGAITPAAQCQGGHNASDLAALTGVSLVDLDHVPIDRMADILRVVKADPHTMLCHVTCSGAGIRILYRYTSQEPETAYRDAWAWGNQYYAMLTGIEIDHKVSDVTRLSFLSHDPLCYFNPDSTPFMVSSSEACTLADTTADMADDSGSKISRAELILAKQGISFYDGNRHYYLMQIARLLVKMGIDQSEAENYATGRMSDDPTDARNVIAWVYDKFQSDFDIWNQGVSAVRLRAPKDRNQGVRPLDSIEANPSESPLDSVEANPSESTLDSATPTPTRGRGRGQGAATPAQIREYLESNELMRYNVISDTVELWSPEKDEFVAINDRTANTIWQECIDALGLYVKDSDYEKVVKSEFVRAYNPFEAYFEQLPEWDGIDHIKQVADSVKTTTEHHIFDLCFRRWLVGMVASWLSPKVMNETILTLIGEQGIYKSTFFRELLPPQLSKYFMAKGNSSYLTKDDRISVSNYGLIALEEIDSLKDSDLNAVKALVTMETIDERAAYARNREKRPHLASFCATGNNKQFLTDLTGNRRWLPFELIGNKLIISNK